MSDCVGVVGWLFGHDFQPRYDETSQAPGAEVVDGLMQRRGVTLLLKEDIDFVAEMRSHTSVYIHDVCSRCGMIVRRSDEQSQK
jgi:hypothetical protein